MVTGTMMTGVTIGAVAGVIIGVAGVTVDGAVMSLPAVTVDGQVDTADGMAVDSVMAVDLGTVEDLGMVVADSLTLEAVEGIIAADPALGIESHRLDRVV